MVDIAGDIAAPRSVRRMQTPVFAELRVLDRRLRDPRSRAKARPASRWGGTVARGGTAALQPPFAFAVLATLDLRFAEELWR
eukprot:CAMPEP_0198663622 /NCGR_PEP_ID=MMETSP1467-20131203/52690_1 /TAXON_ID=1462469 /ORGANISM="unid. sp., Strain CCMP2135" /LENGTH=81 /DNA_ID=CAMNT_0044400153 /DNA_START=42 /DNA_END=287 /DNA_ORIENTATION=+